MTSIRHALPDEAEALAALHVRTWQEAYTGLMPDDYLRSLTPSERLPMWEQILRSSDRAAVFVAERKGEPIGFSCGGISNDEDAEKTTAEMWSIYLLREYWAQGIGKELHDTLITELRRRRFQKATLWVLESNDRTRGWYERQGWKRDGSQKAAEIWRATISEVRYWKELVPDTEIVSAK